MQTTPRIDEYPRPHVREALRLLEAPVRRQILDLATGRPGLAVGEMQASLDVGWGTLHHHLRKMEEAGLVHTMQLGRRRLVFPGGAPSGDGKTRAALSSPTARRVAQRVLDEPGLGIAALLGRLEDSPRAVYYHVKRLVEAGLLVSESPTRYTRLLPAAGLAEGLAKVRGNA